MSIQWNHASVGDRKRYQLIAGMLEKHPKLLEYLFHPNKPELSASPEELFKNPFSSGEKLLLRAAVDLWNADGHVELIELRRLDPDNEIRVLRAYLGARSL